MHPVAYSIKIAQDSTCNVSGQLKNPNKPLGTCGTYNGTTSVFLNLVIQLLRPDKVCGQLLSHQAMVVFLKTILSVKYLGVSV